MTDVITLHLPEEPRNGQSRDATPRERRYYVWTVGCQMNVSDSERLEAALQGLDMRLPNVLRMRVSLCSTRAACARPLKSASSAN